MEHQVFWNNSEEDSPTSNQLGDNAADDHFAVDEILTSLIRDEDTVTSLVPSQEEQSFLLPTEEGSNAKTKETHD